jgi:hypothetical protein
MDNSKMKIVYVISQRSGKSYWNRIGVAFVNNDGSLNVRLEAVPVSGEMQIRDFVPREDFAGSSARPSPANGGQSESSDTFCDLS